MDIRKGNCHRRKNVKFDFMEYKLIFFKTMIFKTDLQDLSRSTNVKSVTL